MFGLLGIEAGLSGGKLALALFKKLWWSIPIIILGIALLTTRHTLANTKQDRDQWHDKFSQEKAAFAGTVANYRAAAETARKADAANKVRVETAQNHVSEEKSNEYETRLADLRRRYDAERMRRTGSAGQAVVGRPGTAPVPVLPDAPGGPDAATAPDPFNAEANAIQLEELQRWIKEQEAIPR